MKKNFYDKVANKFGKYSSGVQTIDEFPNGVPEEIFKEKIIKYSGKNKIVLDVGCGDGRFTLSIAKYYKKVIGIDTSSEMLKYAKRLQKEKHITNVSFKNQSIYQTMTLKDYFDVVYSRRGPTDYRRFSRLLKHKGIYVEIDIGEKDAQEIKKIFGRGQNYGLWNKPRLVQHNKELENDGFNILFAKDFYYNEFYQSYNDLDLFLQSVPIFENFDSKKDKKKLEQFVKRFQTSKGIKFSRHRAVIVAEKI